MIHEASSRRMVNPKDNTSRSSVDFMIADEMAKTLALSLLAILKKLSGHLHSMWKFRCDQRHGRDLDHHESERSRQTIQRITKLSSLRSAVLPDDRRIFYPTLTQHLTKPQSLLTPLMKQLSGH